MVLKWKIHIAMIQIHLILRKFGSPALTQTCMCSLGVRAVQTSDKPSSGGGNAANTTLDKFGPALRWMRYEALVFGLLSTPFQGHWSQVEPHDSMSWLYWLLEWVPITHLLYGPRNTEGREKTTHR